VALLLPVPYSNAVLGKVTETIHTWLPNSVCNHIPPNSTRHAVRVGDGLSVQQTEGRVLSIHEYS